MPFDVQIGLVFIAGLLAFGIVGIIVECVVNKMRRKKQ